MESDVESRRSTRARHRLRGPGAARRAARRGPGGACEQQKASSCQRLIGLRRTAVPRTRWALFRVPGVTIVTVGPADGDPHSPRTPSCRPLARPTAAPVRDRQPLLHKNGLIRQEPTFAVRRRRQTSSPTASRRATRAARRCSARSRTRTARGCGDSAARRLHRPGRVRGRLRARRGRPARSGSAAPVAGFGRFLGQREPARLPPRDVLVHGHSSTTRWPRWCRCTKAEKGVPWRRSSSALAA